LGAGDPARLMRTLDNCQFRRRLKSNMAWKPKRERHAPEKSGHQKYFIECDFGVKLKVS
jgi:hypothetical protein